MVIPMADKQYPEDFQKLLTRLRGELNLLNTLNCNAHLYQGDFSIDRNEAERRTSANTDLYVAHLRSRVNPLFIELGKELVDREMRVISGVAKALDDEDYASVARRWLQEVYLTGICW